MELLTPCACQLMASPAPQLSLLGPGVVGDNELACKAGVGEEWGRESSVYYGGGNSGIQP